MKIENRRYLGAKTKLLPFIKDVIKKENISGKVFVDLFGGTGVVGDYFKNDYEIILNDLLYSNYISYMGWFSDLDKKSIEKVEKLINVYNEKDDGIRENYFSKNFSNTYFNEKNSKKIGYIREDIEKKFDKQLISKEERAYLITSLMYAMDSIANTVGHYDAFRKKNTVDKDLVLRKLDKKKGKKIKIYNEDANKLVREIKSDIVYIDPPYNSRQYSGAYHLLENVAKWEKPEVFGVAKKMNRDKLKSEYCTVSAPKVFKELIDNLETKYIIVSFNNMENKGASRSQSKISNEELFNILSEKGFTKIYKQNYKYYSTGKSNIKNHEELLFVCHVGNSKESENIFRIKKKKGYVKSPLNYTGGKHSLLPQILPCFPNEINNFVDLFCGGANVGVNINSERIVLNDKNKKVIELIKMFKEYNSREIINKVNLIIDKYNLSKTYIHGYEYYSSNSSNGVGKYNKENYEKLRNDYNNMSIKNNEKKFYFFTLIIYSFNNQIRFNKDGLYNMPVGKRDFNSRVKEKVEYFCDALQHKNIDIFSKDFRELNFEEDTFIYADPPYFLGLASYNEQSGWTEKDEKDLYDYLEKQHEKGIRFALSNIIEHKGKKNIILEQWIQRNNFKQIVLKKNYNNSNYQNKNNKNKTIEVLVINY